MGDRVGGSQEPVEVIPLAMHQAWKVFDPATKKTIAMFPATAQNMGLRFETEYEGQKNVKYYHTYRFLMLLAKDVSSLPYIVEFKSTSHETGKRINTQFMANESLGVDKISGSVIALGSFTKKDKGNTYAIFTAKRLRETTPAELEVAKKWRARLLGKQVVTDVATEDGE
jgi:hypothetical protein